ncbi:hypothetical protein [Iodobacter sp.]|uniref:hypothetical protein n=1 Tax=Iodobacter sp. TaxID=1915058 RepID=UPI0025E25F96|nr:hypothetical protein [Iodobacter sp.]
MKYFIDRIDFVGEKTPCDFKGNGGNHYLHKGIARILRDENGREYVAGPTCAEKNTFDTNWGEKVPDFTKGAILIVTPTGPNVGSGGGASSHEDHDEDEIKNLDDFAISYLRLRMEKLRALGFFRAKFEPFNPYYEQWKSTRKLDEKSRRHIVNTDQSQRKKAEPFYMERLQKCYATAFFIDHALRHPLSASDSKYLKDYRSALTKTYYLSVEEINKLKEIVSRINDPWFKKVELGYFE